MWRGGGVASPARGPVSRRGEDAARPGLSAALGPAGRPAPREGPRLAGSAKVTGSGEDGGVWGDGRGAPGPGRAGLLARGDAGEKTRSEGSWRRVSPQPPAATPEASVTVASSLTSCAHHTRGRGPAREKPPAQGTRGQEVSLRGDQVALPRPHSPSAVSSSARPRAPATRRALGGPGVCGVRGPPCVLRTTLSGFEGTPQ